MHVLDWMVLGFYLIGVLSLGGWLAKRQKNTQDYFLGGKAMSARWVGVSLAANQVSAISLVSAPAFVAVAPGGGLCWLQYELAVPLAMVGVLVLMGPIYPRLLSASLYEYAERRFGPGVRLALSTVFLVSRGLATGVSLYATALVLSVAMGFPMLKVYFLLGLFAVAYTTLGGIQADVYSDVIQFFVLWAGTLVAMFIAWNLLTDAPLLVSQLDPARLETLDFRHHGFGDGRTFSFWPMVFGAFFLYMSYYGCDQSQAQRLMATGGLRDIRRSLLINGAIRFPLVLTYCLFGLLLAALVEQEPAFAASLQNERPDYLVPAFLVTYLPVGFRGLVMAGIFAAAMSSIDSALNSLSAVTLEDFLLRWRRVESGSNSRRLFLSRVLTIFWGGLCLGSGLLIARSSKTVIELVNMIGSFFYGPILAVFFCGMLFRGVRQKDMLFGLAGGVLLNLVLWRASPATSWLWWNPAGFFAAVVLAGALARLPKRWAGTETRGAESPPSTGNLFPLLRHLEKERGGGQKRTVRALVLYFLVILTAMAILQVWIGRMP